jgi:hypothetical protein
VNLKESRNWHKYLLQDRNASLACAAQLDNARART